MAIRIIVTDSSVWTLDYGSGQFRRDPRVDGAEHPLVRYTCEWRDFDHLVEEPFTTPDRIRFSVFGRDVDGQGSQWITSTYKPEMQAA